MKCGVRLCDGRAEVCTVTGASFKELLLSLTLVGSSFLAVAVETASSALPAWPRRSDAHDDIVEVRPRLFARSEQMSGEAEVDWANSYCPQGCPGRGGSHAYQNRRCVEGILGR